MNRFILVGIVVLAGLIAANGAVYEVKPNTALDTIGEVPWATLQPGDLVLIHWRSTPYKEKWVICRQGTASLPITVRGVPNGSGQLPVIDGNGAVTVPGVNFASEARGVIKIGASSVPQDTMPKFIVIENLEIRGAHPNYQFTDDGGATQTYSSAASPIFVEKGENLVFRNNIITDGANGFFAASTDTLVSRDILVEGNYIYGNGIVDSILQHNNYTAAINITFQYNRFGPLRSGARGVNLKDRSAGLIVRYNWIEGGNRTIDMVNGEDSLQIRNHPEYNRAFVYGNVLIKGMQDASNNQVIHFGGDTGSTASYRQGPLYLYNNTIYSTRTGNTVVVRLSAGTVSADARNNIFFNTQPGANMALLAETGSLTLANNWAKAGWVNSHEGGAFTGTVTGGSTTLTGTDPGFTDTATQNFRLVPTAPVINEGAALHPEVLTANNLSRQYVRHQTSETRPTSGSFDLGAFEFASAAPMQIGTTSLANAVRHRSYNETLQASGGSGSYSWSVSAGTLPPGLWLDPATGAVRGRVRLKGTWNFTLTVQDAQNASATASQTFTVTSRLFP